MTRKRYIGLVRTLMLRINDGTNPNLPRGQMLKMVEKSDPFRTGKFKSYQEAWDSLLGVRKTYGMA